MHGGPLKTWPLLFIAVEFFLAFLSVNVTGRVLYPDKPSAGSVFMFLFIYKALDEKDVLDI